MLELPEMARKKIVKPDPERHELIALRCTAQYKAWVKSFAKSEFVNPTQLVAIGLKHLAQLRGFQSPPDR